MVANLAKLVQSLLRYVNQSSIWQGSDGNVSVTLDVYQASHLSITVSQNA